jgi:glycosyltransferase involved in cell wall biosynthesis
VRRIVIATDAWHPQVNGVVRTLDKTAEELGRLGVEAAVVGPASFFTVPMPTYPEIRLTVAWPKAIGDEIARLEPDHVHIATEGPIGFAARRWCLSVPRPFTTSFHTRFPEYVAERAPVPLSVTYGILRRFHNAGAACMVSTESLERELAARGFTNLVRWSRGVDPELFKPRPEARRFDLPRPIFLYVGRVAPEKNLRAFLDLDLPGSKAVVGGGPDLAGLKADYPLVHFTGPLFGEDLAGAYASGDVFVFPSRTDTFGVVLLEALASGLPVAAFPVTGPADVIGGSDVGVLSEDLRAAALAALDIPKDRCRNFARGFEWRRTTEQFLDNIQSVYDRRRAA